MLVPGEEGYVLLTLLLVIALMAIFAIAVITPIKFEIQRDQEQEMIHRGVQYSRAIRGYYKKFGRYPMRLEDLDNTNNLRYLRKHYKDPLNKNQDFKLLHFGEPGVTLGGGISLGGGTIPGANPIGGSAMNSSSPTGSAFWRFGIWQSRSEQLRCILTVVRNRKREQRGRSKRQLSERLWATRDGFCCGVRSLADFFPELFSDLFPIGEHNRKLQRAATRDWRAHRGRRQRQQENHDSGIQSQEEV